MPLLSRRRLLATAPLLLAPAFGRAQAAFPSRPVRMVVPYPPGGSVDPVARLLSEKLSALWGQQVVVDNKPGASTILGTDLVAKAQPDGHTILFTASTHVSNALLFNSLPYDSVKDFAPLTPVYKAEFVLVANAQVAANTLQELVVQLKAQPGRFNYGSAGNGNMNHLLAEMFAQQTGTRLTHVPYKGGAPLITDMLGGLVQLYFAVPAAVLQHVQQGRMKALAVTGDKRMALLPNVPTFAEAGLPNFGLRNWLGFFAPAGTPAPVVQKIAADLGRVLAMKDVADKLTSQGQLPFTQTPEQFAALMREDFAEYGKVIKTANIKIDQ